MTLTFNYPPETVPGIGEPACKTLTRTVHGADIPAVVGIVREAAALQAIAHGFAAICPDDHRKLELEFPVYDAPYAWCQAKAAGLPV